MPSVPDPRILLHSLRFASIVLMLLVCHFLQSNETKGSSHMELEGLRRSLTIFEANGLVVDTLVTDRHCQIKAYMAREHGSIQHKFDCWHVAKSNKITNHIPLLNMASNLSSAPIMFCLLNCFLSAIKKKLVAAGKLKKNEALNPWVKAVTTHLYWCAGSSEHNPALILPKWVSVASHVANIHRHGDPLYPVCQHGELRKKWLCEGRYSQPSLHLTYVQLLACLLL